MPIIIKGVKLTEEFTRTLKEIIKGVDGFRSPYLANKARETDKGVEIPCGYGKLLAAVRQKYPEADLLPLDQDEARKNCIDRNVSILLSSRSTMQTTSRQAKCHHHGYLRTRRVHGPGEGRRLLTKTLEDHASSGSQVQDHREVSSAGCYPWKDQCGCSQGCQRLFCARQVRDNGD